MLSLSVEVGCVGGGYAVSECCLVLVMLWRYFKDVTESLYVHIGLNTL